MLDYYGVTKSAEARFNKLLRGVMKYKDGSPKVTLFAAFMGLLPCNEGDFEFYMKAYYFIIKLW